MLEAALSWPDQLLMQVGLQQGQRLHWQAKPTNIFASFPP
jgi:hypothetical protein